MSFYKIIDCFINSIYVMKLGSLNKSNKMIDHYTVRTNNHIDCVRRCIDALVSVHPEELAQLSDRKSLHDLSKWEEPEFTPYIFLTWKHKCTDDGIDFVVPENVDIQEATWHHVSTNPHHPEYWDKNATKMSINPKNRDEPPENPVDATGMDKISLSEMVCDWHAMGLERDNTSKSWADKNVNIRWLFDDDQIKMIYEWIEDLTNKDLSFNG